MHQLRRLRHGLPVRCSEVQQKRQDILLGWPGLGFRSASAASAAHPGKAERCTLCVQRTSNGQVPKCVEACAVKALTFVDYDNLTPEQKALVDKSVALNEAAGTKPKVRYIASHMDIAGRQEKMF